MLHSSDSAQPAESEHSPGLPAVTGEESLSCSWESCVSPKDNRYKAAQTSFHLEDGENQHLLQQPGSHGKTELKTSASSQGLLVLRRRLVKQSRVMHGCYSPVPTCRSCRRERGCLCSSSLAPTPVVPKQVTV